MMANFIGIETFNEGVVAYLNKHKFGNAAKVKSNLLSNSDRGHSTNTRTSMESRHGVK